MVASEREISDFAHQGKISENKSVEFLLFSFRGGNFPIFLALEGTPTSVRLRIDDDRYELCVCRVGKLPARIAARCPR